MFRVYPKFVHGSGKRLCHLRFRVEYWLKTGRFAAAGSSGEGMKKFAFIVLDENADPRRHRFAYEAGGVTTMFRTVRSMAEAKETLLALQKEGVGVVELCGAFGREGALELIDATGGEMGVGYVVTEPSQKAVFERFFSRE